MATSEVKRDRCATFLIPPDYGLTLLNLPDRILMVDRNGLREVCPVEEARATGYGLMVRIGFNHLDFSDSKEPPLPAFALRAMAENSRQQA